MKPRQLCADRDPAWWRDRNYYLLCILPAPFWLIWHGTGGQTTSPAWLLLLVAPIVEEIVFRGALQGWLRTKTRGRLLIGPLTLANGLTATAFGALHAVHHGSGLAMLTFFPGLVFGYCRDRYGSLLPAVIMHFIYNAGMWLSS